MQIDKAKIRDVIGTGGKVIREIVAETGAKVDIDDEGVIKISSSDLSQIEAARRTITHHMRRGGKVWIRIFPDKVVTAKPAETRMGSGKGAPDHWVAVVRPGRIMFEIAGVRQELAQEALRLAGHKLPIGVKFVIREEIRGATAVVEYGSRSPVELAADGEAELRDEATVKEEVAVE